MEMTITLIIVQVLNASHHPIFFQYRMLSFFYVVYLILLTAALVLAARSPDPRVYNNGKDYLRLFFEIMVFLYIIVVFSVDSIILL